MSIKPQDILVALKLITLNGTEWNYQMLQKGIDLSLGEVHNAVKRLTASRLCDERTRAPRLHSLEEFLVHGVKYVFPAEKKSLAVGVPTAWAASPLKESLTEDQGPPPVWPHPKGQTKGYELSPLYPCVAQVALRDPQLYELLALIDGIRGGSTRERELSEKLLHSRLESFSQRKVPYENSNTS